MSDKPTTQSPLLVKKDDVKKGALWNDVANQRINKQHPDGMHEGDRHAIPKLTNPIYDAPQPSEEETKSTMEDLEKQIKQLQEKEKPPAIQSTPTRHQVPDDFDDWYDD